jgi:uroporphyrin-III C-methyltransferase/precorrin-2 dehydrogenase/sirohydrochlorin ferrochelatase
MTTSIELTQKKPEVKPRSIAKYLTLAIRTADLPCLVVGGGRVGTRKAITLCRAGAKVTVLSPEISPQLQKFVHRGQIEWRESQYTPSQISGFRLVVAATADPLLNIQIGQDAETEGIFSCVASSADSTSVIFPAVCSQGDLTIAVHSQGRNCRRSKAVRNRIAVLFSSRKCTPRQNAPQLLLEDVQQRQFSENDPTCPDEMDARWRESPGRGKVTIVGAGPGASDLISLRGYHALQSADAILIDQLIPPNFLEDLGISATNKLIQWLGSGDSHWTQKEINRWLVAAAEQGRTVVRLKGGDPFVFGRGDSEIESLENHRIPWEVIPGASSATAVLTSAGLPLTRHGQGRSFTVTTARIEGGRVSESLPRADSLVILMGISVLDQVLSRLTTDGWSPETPAAIVERGTLAWERQISGPLSRLSELAQRANVASPALVVIGEAARAIAAFRRWPTILFTGLDPTSFRTLGNVLHWPAQAIVSNPEGCNRLPRTFASLNRGEIDWAIFTDKLAVQAFWTAAADQRLDARLMHNVKIAALGTETVRRLEQCGLCADVVITEGDIRQTATQLGELPRKGVLIVQGSHTPRGLCSQLEEAGAAVNQLILHRLVPHPELGRPLPAHNVIYFVSPAGVRSYAEAYGKNAFQREVWCLGEATQKTLAAYGVQAIVVRPTPLSLLGLTRKVPSLSGRGLG